MYMVLRTYLGRWTGEKKATRQWLPRMFHDSRTVIGIPDTVAEAREMAHKDRMQRAALGADNKFRWEITEWQPIETITSEDVPT